jgi:hypothetical protein
MNTAKKLGIWMDHANAYPTESGTHTRKLSSIQSRFTHKDKVNALNKSESLMHNQEQHEQSAFYKEVGAVMRNYDRVLLFGPTDAKTELLNIVRADHRFEKIGIDVEETDKMTPSEQQRFIHDHFSK